jgi:hypothetical protein
MKTILSIDPSGNFSEGKGKTGWALFFQDGAQGNTVNFGTIKAEDYTTRVDYWYGVAMRIVIEKPAVVVVEDYRLYNTPATGAAVQSFSQLETPRLLGVIEQTAQMNGIPIVFQMANVTKPYTDDKLAKLKLLIKEKNRWWFRGNALNDHERSALRHLLRYLDKEGIKI